MFVINYRHSTPYGFCPCIARSNKILAIMYRNTSSKPYLFPCIFDSIINNESTNDTTYYLCEIIAKNNTVVVLQDFK